MAGRARAPAAAVGLMTAEGLAAEGLAVDGVGVRFGALHALRDVSFTVQPGELTAVIGPNGAGKSTLTGVLSGALPLSAGRIRFRGRAVTGGAVAGGAARTAAAGLVRTFQGLDLFESLSVRDNVVAGAAAGIGFWRCLLRPPGLDGRAARLRPVAEEALEVVGLRDRADDPAAILPAGQRRLLAVARAYATGAPWLVLDEPGAGLNEAEKGRLVATIRRLHAAGRTILFIEHDMEVVHSLARRILVLDRGRLIADGPAAAVRRDPAVVAAYLGVDPAPRPPRPGAARPAPLLRVEALHVAYGQVTALAGVGLQAGAGELVAVVGANGAGKSTLLKAVAGVVPPRAGRIAFEGRAAGPGGVALVPEGRELFPSLSVEDNLLLGAWSRTGLGGRLGSPGARRRALERDGSLDRVYALFPRLAERRRQLAGGLSGGEAQMVAIGRALMSAPRLLLLDEPSLGLAPMLVEEILDRLCAMRDEGLGILLVEQLARAALSIADHGYVLQRGRVVAEGPGRALLDRDGIADAYLGAGGPESPRATPQPAFGAAP